MAFIDIFNFKKYFAKPSDSQVARYGHVNALYDATQPKIVTGVITQQTDLTTSVTLDTYAGRIILAANFSIIDGLETTFTFNNNKIAENSTILLTMSGSSGTAMYSYMTITGIQEGSCDLNIGVDPQGVGIVNPVVHFLIINP